VTADAPPEEPPVGVHKPKPWRGLRGFAKEYLIIVIGVLTALGAQQVVETLHQGNEVAEAREALHAELAVNASTGKFVQAEVDCLAGQLDALDAWANGGARPGVIRTQLPSYASSAWDVVKTGAVPHMPLKERLAYSRFYDTLENARYAIENTRNIYTRLNGLQRLEALRSEEARRLIEEIGQARVMGRVRKANGAALVDRAKALGVEPDPFSQASKDSLTRVCGRPFGG
jgi:hypothetical protein